MSTHNLIKDSFAKISLNICLLELLEEFQGKQKNGLESAKVAFFYKSIAGRYRPVSYPDGSITARYRFIKMLTGSHGKNAIESVEFYCAF